MCREFSGVVWIDEAYADFADDTCLDMVRRYPNVVVSRTFSKSYSLAGLRLGLALAPVGLIAEMNKVKDSYNVDMVAQALGAAALRATAVMRENVDRIRATRGWTTAELTRLGCRVLPSQSNFLFVQTPRPAVQVFNELRSAGYLVRYFPLPRVSSYIRVTVGTDAEMRGFVAALTVILASC